MYASILRQLKQTVGIDLRSLALFRICVATLILVDLCLRARDLTAHYTDAGVLPQVYFLADRTRWSLHLISGSAYFQAFMFLLAGVFAVSLLVGYRTRLTTFLSFVLLVSLQGRNFMILDTGDGVLRMMVFWGMFLPLGARFSIDCRTNPPASRASNLYASIATLGFIVQLCLIYWMPVLRRTDPDWWNGNALFYALHYDPLLTEWGRWMRESSWPLSAMSLWIIWWEAIGPALLWIPCWTKWLRIVVIVGFVMLHAGIAMTMTIGFFASVCISAWLVMLPALFWNFIEERFPRVWPEIVGAGSRDRKPTLTTNILAGFFLVYIVAWNLRLLDSQRFRFPIYLNAVAYCSGVRQNWNMFTPGPPKRDAWYVVPGRLRNGQEVDLMTNGDRVTWEKPQLVSRQFRNQRWCHYYRSLEASPNDTHWQFYSTYVQRKWNQSHSQDEQLEDFRFYAMYEETKPDHITAPQEQLLWTYRVVK